MRSSYAHLMKTLWFTFLCLFSTTALAAGLPPELEPWVAWVEAAHPSLHCPVVQGKAACVWPGALVIDAAPGGGSFSLEVTVDRRIAVPLAGGLGTWPQQVRVGGRLTPVRELAGGPAVTLEPGRHRVTGAFVWGALPQSIPVPPLVGQVNLRLDGTPIQRPRIDSNHHLVLNASQGDEPNEQSLEIDVARRITDGVPVVVTTKVDLRVSGTGREVILGAIAIPGTQPVALQANLPVRIDDAGNFVVQVRPGDYTLTFEALHDGPVSALRVAEAPAPWPPQETWVVATNDTVRALTVSGPPGVDPARTTLPEEWRSLPAFLVSPDQPMAFEELRRGVPEPPPNQLNLQRQFWLDFDGSGWTVQDTFDGQMHQKWRLTVQPPLEPGHVKIQTLGADGQPQELDQVVTFMSPPGFEIRDQNVHAVTESRLPHEPEGFRAVGWDTEVRSLASVVHLPPGWTLLGGQGVDVIHGSVLDQWTLLDLFFVLVTSLVAAKLLGKQWGLVALVGLALSRHQTGAPEWLWVVVLSTVALLKVLPEGKAKRVIKLGHWGFASVLFVVLLSFAFTQIQTGLFPVLDKPWNTPSQTNLTPEPFQNNIEADLSMTRAKSVEGLREQLPKGMASDMSQVAQKAPAKNANRYLSLQFDPGAVTNTGPGVPYWTWNSWNLEWNGPVSAEQHMRLFVVGPIMGSVGQFLRVILLAALALRLVGFRPRQLKGGGPMTAAALLLMVPLHAQAAPSPELLKQLEARLTAPAACQPTCAVFENANLTVVGNSLRVSGTVNIAAPATWAVPGPTSVWVPDRVEVNGLETHAMARMPDGFLHVRLEPGVHQVEVVGRLPQTDALTLAFGHAPKTASFEGMGWTLDGLHANGTIEGSIQLSRVMKEEAPDQTQRNAENLAPWLEVHRTLDLGIPWRVKTMVRRVGPSNEALTLRVPLLPSESVTTEAIPIHDGHASLAFGRDQQEIAWISTLVESPQLEITAPNKVPWTEVWTLSCSPVFSCTPTGLAPLRHVHGGQRSQLWRAWPGETLSIEVVRPPAMEGQTVTIDDAKLSLSLGSRLTEAELAYQVRSSRGGRQVVTLPDGARLQTVAIDGVERPLQATDGTVNVPLQPGSQQVEMTWQHPHPTGFVDQMPAVDLGIPAVNAEVIVNVAPKRWVMGLFGPRWGPVPLFWSHVVLVLCAAPLLARLPWTPLGALQWALLGLGLIRVSEESSFVVPAVVVFWFVALGLRRDRWPDSWWRANLIQLGLVGLTFMAMGALYAGVHAGLLFEPDMQIKGNSSSNTLLRWFVDRTDGTFPQPTIVSLPLWVWRILMLAWSLWLAAQLVRWLPWAWGCFGEGGFWRKHVKVGKPTP